MRTANVIIIGAGMSGLTAANELQRHGLSTLVLDKGRAVGGRMATRRVGEATFDHGAQHFSVRSPEFARAAVGWSDRGVVHEWFWSHSTTQPSRSPEPRHAVGGGMRRLPEHLAKGLDVLTSTQIGRLEGEGSGAVALADDRAVAHGGSVIITPPVPQTMQLLADSDLPLPRPISRMLESVTYNACLALMARLDGPSGLPDGHLALGAGPIAWIADNQDKGVSSVPAVTVQSTAQFAADHLAEDVAQWTGVLARHAEAFLASSVVESTGHRWRFSEPQRTFDVGAVPIPAPYPIVLAGEVFAGAKVEGAFLSGKAAAATLLELL